MSLSITKIRQATNDEWDAIWRECEYSTYFHSREWAEIWGVYSKQRLRPDAKLILFSDGKKVLLPFSSQKSFKGLVKSYLSSPAGTFGGWLSIEDLHTQHIILLINCIAKKFGNLFWRINPYDKLVLEAGVKNSKNDETHVLNLSDGFDAVYKRGTKGHKSASRKALKEGISVRLASSLDDWGDYYAAYEDSLRRWGEKASSIYGWELFKEMFGRTSPDIKLWLGVHHDKIASGALCFYAKNHVVWWHGATFSKYFNLRPVNLLVYEIIRDACDKSYAWFDFNPSGGHEGVKKFKKNFGAEALISPMVTQKTLPIRILNRFQSFIKGL